MNDLDRERLSSRDRMDGKGVVQCPAGHDKRQTAISRYDGYKPVYRCGVCHMEWQYELTTRTVVLSGPGMQA